MNANTRNLLRRVRWTARTLVIALLPAVFAACGGGEPSSDAVVEESGTSGPSEPEGGPGLRGDTVEVHMDEYTITMPDTLPARPLVFLVRNMGFEEHNFEILLDDELLWEFDRPLNPRQSQEMEVELEPGTYRVVCTVSGHDGRGMVRDLHVEE